MLLLEAETPQLSATQSQTGSDSIITKNRLGDSLLA